MLDLLCKSGRDEVFLDEGVAFDDTLPLCLQEVQLLDDVGVLLVVLLVLVDIGKESPVVEVIDGILEDGVGGLVTPKATMEPGREWLHQLVRGVVGSGIQFDDLCFFFPFSPTVKSCHPSIIELLDKAGELFGPIVKRDGEVWKVLSILFISDWTLAVTAKVLARNS